MMGRDLSRQLTRVAQAVPPSWGTGFDWDAAVRCALAGTGTSEQVAAVFSTELLAERREQLGYAPLLIALRRAALDNTNHWVNALGYPPDQEPPEYCLLWLRSAFAWLDLPPGRVEAYAQRTGLSVGEVRARRRAGQEMALIAGDPVALGLRRRVWLDQDKYWVPNPEIGEIAADLTIPRQRVYDLLPADRHSQDVLTDTGFYTTINTRSEWNLLEVAALIDHGTQNRGGRGTWSEHVRKRHSPAEMSGMSSSEARGEGIS
jgi:hypothetical protein